jgi:hypothetical protein
LNEPRFSLTKLGRFRELDPEIFDAMLNGRLVGQDRWQPSAPSKVWRVVKLCAAASLRRIPSSRSSLLSGRLCKAQGWAFTAEEKGKEKTTMNGKSLAALAFALLFAFAPLLGTEEPAKVQITKKDAEERLDIAIGLFRMAVAAEDKLIDWYPADQDDPKVKAVATDYCGNLDLLMETARNLGEIANPKNKALFSDPDISDRVRQVMRLEKTFTSESWQLMGMGFSCPSN